MLRTTTVIVTGLIANFNGEEITSTLASAAEIGNTLIVYSSTSKSDLELVRPSKVGPIFTLKLSFGERNMCITRINFSPAVVFAGMVNPPALLELFLK